MRKWYKVYADVNLHYGAFFACPGSSEAIEVIDLDSAAGVRGAVLVERGYVHVNPKAIVSGASICGRSKEEAHSIIRALTVYGERYYGKDDAFRKKYPRRWGLVLEGLYLAHTYHGFDGGPDKVIALVPRDYSNHQLRVLEDEWRVHRVIKSSCGNRAIMRVVREMMG